jgi:hypothetical protein
MLNSYHRISCSVSHQDFDPIELHHAGHHHRRLLPLLQPAAVEGSVVQEVGGGEEVGDNLIPQHSHLQQAGRQACEPGSYQPQQASAPG